MTAGRLEEDLHVNGALTCKTLNIPAGTITNSDVGASAGIEASKLQHQHEIVIGEESAVAANDQTKVAHVVVGATGEIVSFKAGHVVALTGTEVCTVELKKNGTTVLTTPVNLTTSHTARQVVSAVVGTTALAVDDVLEVDFDFTAGAGAGAGQFAILTIKEDAT